MTGKSLKGMQRKMAVDGTVEWMDKVIALHERQVKELASRRQAFLASCDEEKSKEQRWLSTPINQLSYFVNEMQNLNINYRLDLVANHAAALALSERRATP